MKGKETLRKKEESHQRTEWMKNNENKEEENSEQHEKEDNH